MSAALPCALPAPAHPGGARLRPDTRASAPLGVALLLCLSCAGVLACEPVPSRRAEIRHDLERAEEHRGWVELWTGLDDREARLELSLFRDRMRKIAATLADNPCLGGLDEDILRSRVRHELAWSERKGSLLGNKVKMIRAGP